ncbi:MAG: HNH endonuclease signature motif containing protein [Intrasporangium sp.]|uniref:HNH endonuclease signature motif containing protein n=1 Tax=Intrasporangium sp. TaxID=1925024 RepID=UPI003F7E5D19
MFESVEAVEHEDPFVLAAALGTLSVEDIDAMTLAETEAVTLASQRVINAVSARQSAAMDTHAARAEERIERRRQEAREDGRRVPLAAGGQDSAAALAPLLKVAPRTMSTRLDDARRLVNALPTTFHLQWSGALEPYRSAAVVRESKALHVHQLEEFEARLHRRDISQLPGSRLKTMARRAAEQTDRAAVRAAEKAAVADRSIRVGPGEVTGTSTWTMTLSTAQSATLWAAVDGLANEYVTATAGLKVGQARVDALFDLVMANAEVRTTIELVAPIGCGPAARIDEAPLDLRDEPEHELPAAFGGPRPHHAAGSPDGDTDRGVGGHDGDTAYDIDCGAGRRDSASVWAAVRASTGTLMDSDSDVWFVSGLTEVPTHGSLLPETVVGLLSNPDVTLRVAWSDPVTGATRSQDPHAYRPNAAVARQVRSRDGTCRFPGCSQPARRTQIDHVVPAPVGPTEPPNLMCLCASHHRFKHHGGWSADLTPEGICTWTAPDGRTHTTWPMDRHGRSAA